MVERKRIHCEKEAQKKGMDVAGQKWWVTHLQLKMNKENIVGRSDIQSLTSTSDKMADINEQNECSMCIGRYEDE